MSAAAAKRTVLAAATAMLLASVVVAGSAGGAPDRDRTPPTPPANIGVKVASVSSVVVEWDRSRDDTGVAGYYVTGYGRKATVTDPPAASDGVQPRPSYEVKSLNCGQSATISIEAFDLARNRSGRVPTTVSSMPCTDTRPPSTPSGFTQRRDHAECRRTRLAGVLR